MTETNLQQLALVLTEVNAAMDLTMLHGFMTGLATNPNDVKSDFVLKSILGRNAPSVRIVVVPTENQMGAIGEATNDTFKYRSKRGNHR